MRSCKRSCSWVRLLSRLDCCWGTLLPGKGAGGLRDLFRACSPELRSAMAMGDAGPGEYTILSLSRCSEEGLLRKEELVMQELWKTGCNEIY